MVVTHDVVRDLLPSLSKVFVAESRYRLSFKFLKNCSFGALTPISAIHLYFVSRPVLIDQYIWRPV